MKTKRPNAICLIVSIAALILASTALLADPTPIHADVIYVGNYGDDTIEKFTAAAAVRSSLTPA